MRSSSAAEKELQAIPGIGPSIAGDLYNIGIRHIEDLRNRDPEKLKWWHRKDEYLDDKKE